MGNIISDIATNDHIISNIRNIQRKYELRGRIESYFASIIKSNSWDKFICKCSKQINVLASLSCTSILKKLVYLYPILLDPVMINLLNI